MRFIDGRFICTLLKFHLPSMAIANPTRTSNTFRLATYVIRILGLFKSRALSLSRHLGYKFHGYMLVVSNVNNTTAPRAAHFYKSFDIGIYATLCIAIYTKSYTIFRQRYLLVISFCTCTLLGLEAPMIVHTLHCIDYCTLRLF